MSLTDYQRSYQVSPIILVNGVALPGGKLPIVAITDSLAYLNGILGPSSAATLDDAFANFIVAAGSSLIDNEIARWPLANQATAANAVISKPLKLSLLMVCPAGRGGIGIAGKQAVMTALQNTLASHIAQGGWFDVSTPAYLYTGCLLTSLADVGEWEEGGQVQLQYRWDFEQPIITNQQAQAVYNTAMGRQAAGVQLFGNPPNSNPANAAVGVPGSNVIQNIVPAATNLVGANIGSIFGGVAVNASTGG